jgi:hypothetical protein
MKAFRSTLLLLAVLGLVGWWAWRDQQSRVADGGWLPRADEVQSVRVGRRAAGLVLDRVTSNSGEWRVSTWNAKGAARGAVPADPEAVLRLLSAWRNARPQFLEGDPNAPLREFGLDAEPAFVQFGAIKVECGAPAPIDPLLFYARVHGAGSQNGTPRLALLPRALLRTLDPPFEAWRDKRLLAFEDAGPLQVLVTRGGRETVLERRGERWTWRAPDTKAAALPADPAVAQSAVASLLALRASGFSSSPAQPKASEDEAISIRVRRGAGRDVREHTARIELPTADAKNARAQSSRLPDVALLEASAARELAAGWQRPAREWRQKELFGFGVGKPTQVFISARGRTWMGRVADGLWQRDAQDSTSALPPERARAEKNAVTDLVLAMSQLKARDFEAAARPLQVPPRSTQVLEVRVQTPDGPQRLLAWREPARGRTPARAVARIETSWRNDAKSTLFVLDDDALAAFEPGLNTLFPAAK